jgi:hypothetical protein
VLPRRTYALSFNRAYAAEGLSFVNRSMCCDHNSKASLTSLQAVFSAHAAPTSFAPAFPPRTSSISSSALLSDELCIGSAGLGVVGEIMTELMLEEATQLNIELFRLNRLANIKALGR